MKKFTQYFLVALTLLAAGTAARAQGTVDFANDSSSAITDSASGQLIRSQDHVSAALYWSPDGVVDYVQLGAAVPVGTPNPGDIFGGTRTTGNSTAGGTAAMFLVRVWVGNQPTYEAAVSNGAITASSPAFSVVTGNPGGEPPTPPAALIGLAGVGTGLQSFPLPLPPQPPEITAQPVSRTKAFGQTVSFSVTATGAAPLAYQWYFNGTNLLAGQTSSALSLTNLQAPDAGEYSVTVSNIAGTVTSSNATLLLLNAPTIQTHPADQTVTAGSNATLSVSATGDGTLYYFWRLNGTNLAGGNSSTYTVSNASLSKQGNYSVVVSNLVGQVTSSNAFLTVLTAPVITLSPTNRTVIAGNATTFSLVVSGATPMAFQWRFNGTNVANATNSSYTLNNVQASNAGSYSVTVSNIVNTVASSNGVLTVITPPVITAQPTNRTVATSGSTTFTVGVTGSAPLTYRWRFNGTNLVNATNSSYSLNNAVAANAGDYSVIVSNAAGSSLSSNAVLTVSDPTCVTAPTNLTAWWRAEGDAVDFATSLAGTNFATTYSAGLAGQAFDFNGTNAYVSVASTPANKFTGPFTVEGWIYLRSLSGIGGEIIVKGIDTEQAMDWGLLVVNGTRKLRPMIRAGSVWNYFDGAATLTSNTWYHVAMVFDGSTTRGYVNGVQDSSSPTPGAVQATDAPLRIGAYAPVYGTDSKAWFNGKIDELSLYNRALTTNELQAIYNAGALGKCATATFPVILTQPQGLAVSQNSSATFSVFATGGALTYQWRLNGTNLTGATGTSYTLSSAQASNAGNYSVVVSNAAGVVTSSNASLNVTIPPFITNQPQGGAFLLGAGVNLSVGADGGAPLSYQWRLNGNALAGSTNPAYAIASLQSSNLGTYVVVITNPYGSLTSSPAVVSAGFGPIITNQPLGQTVTAGNTVTLSVTAGGNPPPAYLWQLNGTNLNWATSNRLTFPNAQLTDAGDYTVTVSNAFGVVVSSNATLTVNAATCFASPADLVAGWAAESNTLDSIGLVTGTPHSLGYAPGKVNTAFDFNGTNAYVEVPSRPAISFSGAFTVEAWVNYRSLTANGGVIVAKGADVAGPVDWTLSINANGRLRPHANIGILGGSWQYFDCNTTISTGVWHHVAMVWDGAQLRGYLDGQLDGTLNISFPGPVKTTTNSLRIGAYSPGTSSQKILFDGRIDELALYGRGLSAAEILALYNASTAGKCPVPTMAPYITAQPQSVAASEGGNAAFSVTALGSTNLTFQWALNGNPLPGATGATLAYTNLQLNQAGDYSVTVSNELGTVTSSNATLTLTPLPTEVRFTSATAMSGTAVSVPVLLVAKGRENAAGFSLSFNPAQLTYSNVVLGADAAGGTLILNASGVSTGRLGLAVALGSGVAFPAGTQQLAVVTFTSPVNTSTQAVTAAVNFADAPVTRQVSATNPVVLTANYYGGTLTLLPTDLEGDAAPRPAGDRAVGVIDWVQAGRYAALLDTPADGTEFQRADCAPRGNAGDGLIKVTDWVQTGRYLAGLDPLTPAGGPTNPAAARGGLAGIKLQTGTRQLTLTGANAVQGVPVTVSVNLQSLGDETAVGFSVAFDAAKFTYLSTAAGSGAGSATVNVNTNLAAAGKLGVVVGLPSGNFPAGNCELVRLTLLPTGNTGTVGVAFADQPLPRSISDAAANELGATYVTGTVTVNPVPTLDLRLAGSNAALAWPRTAEGFSLQVRTSFTNGWTDLGASAQTNGGNYEVTLPTNSGTRYFRLRHP